MAGDSEFYSVNIAFKIAGLEAWAIFYLYINSTSLRQCPFSKTYSFFLVFVLFAKNDFYTMKSGQPTSVFMTWNIVLHQETNSNFKKDFFASKSEANEPDLQNRQSKQIWVLSKFQETQRINQ